MAIDLTVLAESLPQKWAFLLTGIACVWGLGSAVTALICITHCLLITLSEPLRLTTSYVSMASCRRILLPQRNKLGDVRPI